MTIDWKWRRHADEEGRRHDVMCMFSSFLSHHGVLLEYVANVSADKDHPFTWARAQRDRVACGLLYNAFDWEKYEETNWGSVSIMWKSCLDSQGLPFERVSVRDWMEFYSPGYTERLITTERI